MNENEPRTAKERIETGEWVHCRLCEVIFKRKRETMRYCHQCGDAFCEGEHGTFDGK